MLLCGFNLEAGSGQTESIDKINSGDFVGVFESPFPTDLLRYLIEDRIYSTLGEKYLSFIQNPDHDVYFDDKEANVLPFGVAPLILFIQKNWTGPDLSLSQLLVEFNTFAKTTNVITELAIDGENVMSVVQYPELLYISKNILQTAYHKYSKSQETKIWYLRSLFIHQQILEELSPELYKQINDVICEIRENLNSFSNAVAVALHLEFARIFMYYGEVQKSKEDLQKVTNLSGIELSLSGALGKRTKFQSEDRAQLILKVNVNKESSTDEQSDETICKFPNDLKLDDEVRLDKIKFADNLSNSCPDLSGMQQAVILANLFQTQKSQPKDNLADEELQPLIQCILEQPKVWSIRMTALLLRSTLEGNHKRTVERSMMQLQVLVDSTKDSNVTLVQRMALFFISHLPPKWKILSVLADTLTSMGSVKSALEIYLSLEDWENVIMCYNVLQMRHKAQEIIEQELKKNPSPKLWCFLGDATDDVSCYQKAWDLSERRSARSQRHWALFYYYRQNYAESIEHFQKSLEINSLQKEMWYRLGYAALMAEKWEISATAYRRYVILDPDCFEAWNNLGRCYCELKQKQRAWRALQEALKVDYSNWKVWDNYMVVSSDLKLFDDVIKSYHEILNIKGKHLDTAVLNGLVVGFKTLEAHVNEEESDGNEKFRSKLLALFGRLTSQIINDSELWLLYSEVVGTDTPENLTKKQQLLVKAHRSAINKTGWEKNLENCNRIIYVLSKLVEVGLSINKPDVLMSCKLAATGALAKIKSEYPDANICESLEKNLTTVEKLLKS